jgi:hypothetical protein
MQVNLNATRRKRGDRRIWPTYDRGWAEDMENRHRSQGQDSISHPVALATENVPDMEKFRGSLPPSNTNDQRVLLGVTRLPKSGD